MTEIFLGAAISGIMGFLLVLPAIILETRRRRGDNLPMMLDVRFLWNWKLNDREIFAVSLLLHLIVATLVGGFYVLFANNGWLFITHTPFAFHSVMIFTIGTWLVTGLLVYPLLGMGWFAHREGKHMWFEMLITHLLIGFGFWIGLQYYHPFFF